MKQLMEQLELQLGTVRLLQLELFVGLIGIETLSKAEANMRKVEEKGSLADSSSSRSIA